MKELYIEFAKKFGIAAAIFAVVFIALTITERCLGLTLMAWNNTAFTVGFAASVIGVAYVLTVTNPQNYVGFYGGIIMSALLAVQFWLNRQYDLVILYIAVFIPFLIRSIVVWKRGNGKRETGNGKQETGNGKQETGNGKQETGNGKQETGNGKQETGEELKPAWLNRKALFITLLIACAIIACDYALGTRVIYKDGWGENILIKLMSAGLICSSTLANYWLIYKKTDAWIWWTIYAVAGIVFYAILPVPNIFLIVLNIVFLFVNGSALIAWIKITPRNV